MLYNFINYTINIHWTINGYTRLVSRQICGAWYQFQFVFFFCVFFLRVFISNGLVPRAISSVQNLNSLDICTSYNTTASEQILMCVDTAWWNTILTGAFILHLMAFGISPKNNKFKMSWKIINLMHMQIFFILSVSLYANPNNWKISFCILHITKITNIQFQICCALYTSDYNMLAIF